MKQRLAILGSTGSIGVQTLDIVRENPALFEVRVLTANCNWQRLAAQAREFDADTAVIADERYYGQLRDALAGTDVKVYAGEDAVAQVAAQRGDTADYDYFLDRSKSYRHFFDPETRFMRGLDSKGGFRTPFNPFASTHREDDYCEGNAWQYTWLVPHDVEGLIGCFGGKEAFVEKLDSLFTVSSVLEGAASPDISGLIGQYAHGNEPSHHVVYLYTMIGQPWKTADKVREILTTLYHDQPDGLSGNEDVGQMSAWYVLSSLGFYQVEPAGGRYFFGSPLFDRAEVRVRDGVLTVTAHNNSAANKYIQAVKLNGKPYTKPYIAFDDIAAGGRLEFEMGAQPAVWYEL